MGQGEVMVGGQSIGFSFCLNMPASIQLCWEQSLLCETFCEVLRNSLLSFLNLFRGLYQQPTEISFLRGARKKGLYLRDHHQPFSLLLLSTNFEALSLNSKRSLISSQSGEKTSQLFSFQTAFMGKPYALFFQALSS